MLKPIMRRTVPALPYTSLALGLLFTTCGEAKRAEAIEPVMPDVSLPAATEQTGVDPVSELPPPPAEPATPGPAKVSSDTSAKTSKAVAPPVVLQIVTPRTSSSSGTAAKPKAWRGESLKSLAKRLNVALPLPRGRIVVSKSQRRLDLYNGEVLLKSYQVALGPNPIGHKQEQGDGRTPEGQFYICTRNSKTSAFHIFLGLSYPALPDATQGVQRKAISPREFQIIRQRLAARGAPLWETRLGGWIGIHGGTDAAFAKRTMRTRQSRDWTAGCVALTNREIEELHLATRIGTPVLVKP